MLSHRTCLFSFAMIALAACGGPGATAGQASPDEAATHGTAAAEQPSPSEPTPQKEPGAAPSGPEADRACAKDDECILSTFAGCCSCCVCAPLHALRADAERARQDACADEACGKQDCSKAECVPCASLSPTVRAVCADGLCTIAP
jgi:hypothetical protein